MPEPKVTFEDGEAYERFMGRWSRAAGQEFLAWLAPPHGARWLDVGCGTGAFTQLVLDRCAPASVAAVDPAAAQIEHARRQPAGRHADFRVGDALALPFADGSFDVVASALVINFVPDHGRALAEMRRVAQGGGIVAGYVWDRAPGAEFSPSAPMQRAMRDIGADVPRIPGADMGSLASLFAAAGLETIESTRIEVTQTYRDFDDYWQAQTPAFSPAGKLLAKMPYSDHARLRDALRAMLPADADGTISYASCARAVKARAPFAQP